MKYSDIFLRLTYETASLVFIKKDGTIRTMLASRNINTARLNGDELTVQLAGHDNRCNINNGNIAVVDLAIGDVRSFNIDRLASINWLGEVKTNEDLESIHTEFLDFEKEYNKRKPKFITMDMLTEFGY